MASPCLVTIDSRTSRIRHKSTYADDRIMPTVAWCASLLVCPQREHVSVGPSARPARRADRPIHRPPRTGFDLPQRGRCRSVGVNSLSWSATSGNGVLGDGDVLPQAGPEVRVLAAGSTIPFSGIQGKPDDVGDLGDRLGIGGEFERSARQGWIPWSRHTHRAVADSQMLGQQPRTPVCDTVFLRWRQRDQCQGCRGPGLRCRPERSSSDLTYPPSPERRTAGREVWSPSSCRPESPRRPG